MDNNSGKAKIGGVFSIISGAFGILWGFCLFISAIFIGIIPRSLFGGGFEDLPGDIFPILAGVYGFLGFITFILGVLGIVGGIFALKRKYWGWALAGSIAGIITFCPAGIPATIFVSLGRSEFKSAQQLPATSQPPVTATKPSAK